MKALALLLWCGGVAFFVVLFSIGYAGEFRFYLNAAPVSMMIDHVSANGKYTSSGGSRPAGSTYSWDIEIVAHDGSERRYLRNESCQDAAEVKLLLESQGKKQVLWILPHREFSSIYRLKNGFPTKWLAPLVMSIVMLGAGLVGLFKAMTKG